MIDFCRGFKCYYKKDLNGKMSIVDEAFLYFMQSTYTETGEISKTFIFIFSYFC